MCSRFILKAGTLGLAVAVFFLTTDDAAAQGLGPNGNLLNTGLQNQGIGGGGIGGLGSGGGPGGILGNLANGLPGQAGNTQQTPGMSPTGRFYNYDLVTGSGQLTGPLPIVTQFAGIAGMRTGGMGGGMGGMMGGMGGMGGGFGMGNMNSPMGGNYGGGAYNGGGMGNMGGNMGLGGMSNQSRNFALLPPGVQLNVSYNTLIGMPITQSPMGQMNGMNGMMNPMMMGGMGMGMGMGRGMGGMGMGGMGGKMLYGYGNGDYGL